MKLLLFVTTIIFGLLAQADQAQIYYGSIQKSGKTLGQIEVRDLNGKLVREIQTSDVPFLVKAIEKKRLIVSFVERMPNDYKGPKYTPTQKIQILNLDGTVKWEYRNNYMHHDFDLLENGNIALLM